MSLSHTGFELVDMRIRRRDTSFRRRSATSVKRMQRAPDKPCAMPVFLSSSIVGNAQNLITFGLAGELMAWFSPHKDGPQHIGACLPCAYLGHANQGQLSYFSDANWTKSQSYLSDSNALETVLEGFGLRITFVDALPDDLPVLARRIRVENISNEPRNGGFYTFGDWNMGGNREGNALVFHRDSQILLQSHRDAALAMGGDALQGWHCGKAGEQFAHNARRALESGVLECQDLEIGNVNFAWGFYAELKAGERIEKTMFWALGDSQNAALAHFQTASKRGFDEILGARIEADRQTLAPGLNALKLALGASSTKETLDETKSVIDESVRLVVDEADVWADQQPGAFVDESGTAFAFSTVPADLLAAYKRSILALPLLCGEEGVAVAAPEFDPEFESCGGYGYFWPRDGAEYVSGLIDASYSDFAPQMFNWCARHQDESGLWQQRYFLNGEPGPNWCLPPETLQIDQVGAVLWAYWKWFSIRMRTSSPVEISLNELYATSEFEGSQASIGRTRGVLVEPNHREMIRRATDYLLSRQDPKTGVHLNAFDTWETFIGSFTYSNAAIYAAFKTASYILGDAKYAEAAQKMKTGVLKHFVRESPDGFRYLTRGFKSDGSPDETVDSASLGAIEPFGLLDLDVAEELELAMGTLRAVTEKLEVDWMNGRAIRRFEGDAYVGGVPACVNTLWMARCCFQIAEVNGDSTLVERGQQFLQVVLKRATPTLLLPELMQGPDGQSYWAAPHGWAMSSFVSGVLGWAHLQN